MPKRDKVPLTSPRDEAALLTEIRRGSGAFRAVVLTRNRRVMASVADGGRTLRLHEAFATAPAEVLHALGRLFTARTDDAKRVARRAVNEFLASHSPAPAPPVARARRIPVGDRPHLERLRAEFDRVNREQFNGTLPVVPLFLSGRMRRRNGHFRAQPLEIVLARRLCTDALPGEAEHTLRHEMIHLWQHVGGHAMGHGAEFRRWARALDVHPRATRPVQWGSG